MFILGSRLVHVRSVVSMAIAAALLAACAAPTSAPMATPTDLPAPPATATSEATPPAQPTVAAPEPSPTASASAPAGVVRLVPADGGNEARYLVREQLADLAFPSDAIGTTTDISGALVVDQDGAFVADESGITVNLASIHTDKDRRDNYVRQQVLETGRYPSAVFVPTQARGLDVGALGSGGATFDLVGDMTVHGVTKQIVWNVTASLSGDTLTGKASTEFAFEDFGMTVPSVMVVLSVEDKIRLEYDFSFVIERS